MAFYPGSRTMRLEETRSSQVGLSAREIIGYCLLLYFSLFEHNAANASFVAAPSKSIAAANKTQTQLLMTLNRETIEVSNPSNIKFDKAEPASDIGFLILGFLGENNGRASVALIKDLSDKKTKPVMAGNSLSLRGKNLVIITVHEKYLGLSSGEENIVAYKDGFPIEIQNRPPPAPVMSFRQPEMSDTFQEDGFERNKGNIRLSDAYRKNIIHNLPDILMQASAEPVLDREGTIVGFLLDQIEPGSIYDKAGLRNGDVVKSINGTELDDIQATIKLLNSLKNAANIEVVLARGGQDLSMAVNVQ